MVPNLESPETPEIIDVICAGGMIFRPGTSNQPEEDEEDNGS